MTDRPIIFSAPMVRALLDGWKTQTRRVIRNVPNMPPADCHPSHTPKHPAPYLDAYCGERKTPANPRGMGRKWHWWQVDDRPGPIAFRLPYAPGDRLWVKHSADVFPISFKPIPGWESLYAAGTDGLIYRVDGAKPEPLQGTPTDRGYLSVSLSRGEWMTKSVHRLVCETFYGPAPFDGAQARHMDGDRQNNRPENLDWGTQADNWRDRKAHGRGMGSSHHSAKLTASDAAEIRSSSLSQRALAARFGVSQSTIGGIRTGKTWAEHEPASRNAPAFQLWKSPLHMPRWASRLTLTVTDVRVQRVQEISPDDAKAEGATPSFCSECLNAPPCGCPEANWDWRDTFADLWDSINAKPRPRRGDDGRVSHYESFPWGGASRVETYRGKPHHVTANPWVVALTFAVHRCNIDQMAEAA